MNPDRIDEILRAEPAVEPSLGFAERVMGAVRDEAAAREGLRFPWRRLAWGMGSCWVVAVATLLISPPGAFDLPIPGRVSMDAARPAAWVAASLLASWVSVWWSLRAVGGSR